MPKYSLTAQVTVSAYTIVEADTLDEAIDIAADREVVIGGSGSGEDEEESWIIDEADGVAENIKQTE